MNNFLLVFSSLPFWPSYLYSCTWLTSNVWRGEWIDLKEVTQKGVRGCVWVSSVEAVASCRSPSVSLFELWAKVRRQINILFMWMFLALGNIHLWVHLDIIEIKENGLASEVLKIKVKPKLSYPGRNEVSMKFQFPILFLQSRQASYHLLSKRLSHMWDTFWHVLLASFYN